MKTKLKKPNDASSWILAIAIVATFLSLSISTYRNFQSNKKNVSLVNQNIEILKLKEKILYYDEVLTMSAMMYTQYGEERWEKRYRLNQVQLDDVLKNISGIAPSALVKEYIANTAAANAELLAMENRAFAFVRSNQLESARAVLLNDAYAEQKKIYKAGMEHLSVQLDLYLSERQNIFEKSLFSEFVITGVFLIFLSLIWFFVFRYLNKSKTQLLNSFSIIQDQDHEKEQYIAELNQAYAELKTMQDTVTKLNESLEQKVLDRTEELAKSQMQFQNLIENISGTYWIMDIQTYKGLYMSPSYETLWGRKCASFYEDSSDFIHAVHPDDRARLYEIYQKIGELNQTGFPFRIIKPEGETRWFAAKMKIVADGNGHKILYGYADDITERKIAEDVLHEQLLVMESHNTQLKDFSYIVSHNLRGPMNNIGMLIEFIESATDPAEQKDLYNKIKITVQGINETLSELVDSLQVKYDKEIELKKIKVDHSIQKTLTALEAEIKSSHSTIDIATSEAPVIHYSEKYLDSILYNLISNALKYRSPNRSPVLAIKTEKRDHSIVLSVADNGLGLDLNRHQNQLFKLRKVFHDHPDAKGFGLFMTKTQVDAMGGRIWVESTPDVGSTFFVEFVNQYP